MLRCLPKPESINILWGQGGESGLDLLETGGHELRVGYFPGPFVPIEEDIARMNVEMAVDPLLLKKSEPVDTALNQLGDILLGNQLLRAQPACDHPLEGHIAFLHEQRRGLADLDSAAEGGRL
jgi:hypothetical protein